MNMDWIDGSIIRGNAVIRRNEDMNQVVDGRQRRRFLSYWVQLESKDAFNGLLMRRIFEDGINGDSRYGGTVWWRESSRDIGSRRYVALYVVSCSGERFGSVNDIMKWIAGFGYLDAVTCRVKIGWDRADLSRRIAGELLVEQVEDCVG